MMDIKLDGLFTSLIIFGAAIVLAIWGIVGLVDWIWVDDGIRVDKPVTPELELIIKDNKVDTVYVYRFD